VRRPFPQGEKNSRHQTSDDRDIFEVINFTEDGADVKIMKRQSHDRVRRMLDLLPEDQREVIILRHYADLSFKEIASLTNCSINTALGRMRYGLINLRKMMVEKRLPFKKFLHYSKKRLSLGTAFLFTPVSLFYNRGITRA